MGVEIDNKTITIMKPMYLTEAILNLSKLKMYEFHYENMVTKYGEKLHMCYMDIGSFIYHKKMHDFHKVREGLTQTVSRNTKKDGRPH